MGIVGITVDSNGQTIQRLAVTTKVSIGTIVRRKCECGGKNDKCPKCRGRGEITFPGKCDHFNFLKKSIDNEWVPDPVLTKHYGESCREFQIVLLDNGIENVFRTQYAWWTATQKECWGDGVTATRRTKENPEGEEWPGPTDAPPCGDGCPELETGKCGPSGDLYFMLADFPRIGSACRLHTRSWNSVRQLHSSLDQIRSVLGRLQGIRAKMVVQPKKVKYQSNGVNKTSVAYVLNLELTATDLRKMMAEATGPAQVFDNTRRLLGAGHIITIEEDETQKAPEIQQEFHPDEVARLAAEEEEERQKAAAPKAIRKSERAAEGEATRPITPEQKRHIWDFARGLGLDDQVTIGVIQGFGFADSKSITSDKFQAILDKLAEVNAPVETPTITNEDIPF